MDKRVLDRIIACDPRYVGHCADGTIALDDEALGRIKVTADEYADEHDIGTDETFYATLDLFLDDVRKTNITPTGDVVDALLDLRRLFQTYRTEQHNINRRLLDIILERTEEAPNV